ncbi:MAG: ribonuclease H-like domain-containing protein [Candidatus Paceibacterota bacterium]|jgi:DEAD/DEAH box helicase domain-containing protein
MRKITFDIETTNLFSEVGSNDPSLLNISVVCVHDSETGEYSSYFQEDFKKLWPIIENADMLIGFNSDHFDIPLLNKYYPGDLKKIKSLDLMKEIKDSLGRRIKLDTIAQATLGKGKIGHGLDAITWWKKGEKDKVVKYCIEDVKITKELYDYARKNGHLKYSDGTKIKEIKLDPRAWEDKEESAITHTLPF